MKKVVSPTSYWISEVVADIDNNCMMVFLFSYFLKLSHKINKYFKQGSLKGTIQLYGK